jgi:hypothetical protein
MGRVNITHKLLSFINPPKILAYVRHLNRASKYSKGKMEPVYLALATMWTNNGLLGVEQVLSTLIDPKNPYRRIYNNILLNINSSQLIGLLLHVYRGNKLPDSLF